MKRRMLWWLVFASVVAMPFPASAETSVGVSINIGNAPPPPVVVFRREPRVVVVPGSTVYMVSDDSDYDVFRYGVYWYVFNDGYWYRARAHRGPYAVVSARYVPAAIVNVPPKYWRHPHGGPPGQMKKRGDYVVVRDRDGRKHNR